MFVITFSHGVVDKVIVKHAGGVAHSIRGRWGQLPSFAPGRTAKFLSLNCILSHRLGSILPFQPINGG